MTETAHDIGRPVRIVSLSFRMGSKSLDEIAAVVDQEGARGCDLVALPETWTGMVPQRLEDRTVTTLAALARAQRILANETPENAGAEDGLRASLLRHAAIRSRDNNTVVFL